MQGHRAKLVASLCLLVAALAVAACAVLLRPEPAGAAHKHQVAAAYGQLPLHFEANQGQFDGRVQFLSRGRGYSLFLTSTEAVLSLARGSGAGSRSLGVGRGSEKPDDRSQKDARPPAKPTTVRMMVLGANPHARAAGWEPLPGKVNYLLGADPQQWRTNVPTYARVHYSGIYPGVDLVYYGNQRQLEYDFVVAPGANPSQIAVGFEGAKVAVDARGDLVLRLAGGGEVRQRRPLLYQEVGGVRREISGRYVRLSHAGHRNAVGFQVAAYDAARPLVIDPTLLYSTFLGSGSDEFGSDLTVDEEGNAYVTGRTESPGFPTTPGAFDLSHNTAEDAFVTKLNPTGTALVYSTYLGGNGIEIGNAVVVDAAGNAYVVGGTKSSDFPTTPGAFDSTFNFGDGDAFIAKLDPSGSALLYSTYLGGSQFESGHRIALDPVGNAYLTGRTRSPDFPATPGALDTTNNLEDAFVTKLNPTGTALVYSTFLGDSTGDQGNGLDLDAAGSAYVTGETTSLDFPVTPGAFDLTLNGTADAFVTKLNPAGSALVYSTYLGGGGHEIGNALAVDGSGSAYLTGDAFSDGFPVTPGAFDTTYNGALDAFATRLNAAGTALVYSTYLGGSGDEFGFGIKVDAGGRVYVAGETRSPDFPTTPGAIQPVAPGGFSDGFVTKLNGAGAALLYSTYLGGSETDACFGLALHPAGSAYLTGDTTSVDFPTTPGAFDTTYNGGFDVFVAKFCDEAPSVTCSVASPILWPPNHNLINVGLQASATDACDGAPLPVTVQVFSDEDDVAAVGGRHSPDARDIGPGTLRLRSERLGNGDGRNYLIVVTATNATGTPGIACCTVVVPHGQSEKAMKTVKDQALVAEASCRDSGGPPAGYFVVGDGPVHGPKQ